MSQKRMSFYPVFIFIFLISSVLILLSFRVMNAVVHPKVWVIQGFLAVLTLISHILAEKGLKKISEFHIYYMGSMGIRFLFSLIFIFICLYFLKTGYLVFIADFFALYLLYTSFEIYFLLRNLRAD